MQASDLHVRLPRLAGLVGRDPVQTASEALVVRIQNPSRIAHQSLDVDPGGVAGAPRDKGCKVVKREVRVDVDEHSPDAVSR